MIAGGLFRHLGRALEWILVALLGALILLATLELFAWILLERSFAPMEEIQGILMIWLGLLGAAYCLEERLHLAVKVVVDRFPEPWRSAASRLASLLTATFGVLLAIYGFGLARAVTNTLPGTGWSASVQYLPAVVAGLLLALIALGQLVGPGDRQLEAAEAAVAAAGASPEPPMPGGAGSAP